MSAPSSKQTEPSAWDTYYKINGEEFFKVADVRRWIKEDEAAKRTELAANWPEKHDLSLPVTDEVFYKSEALRMVNAALDTAWQAVERTFKEEA